LAALVVVLVGAGAHIVHLRGFADLDRRVPAAAGSSASGQPAGREAAAGSDVLTPAQRQALQGALTAARGVNRRAWFQVQANNQDTAAVLAALKEIFELSGWTIETVRAPYALKRGIFLLAADEQPPPAVEAVNEAFHAAGIEVQYLTGYRAFYQDRKQNNPSWVGPELASGQTFVIAIGGRPTPTTP